MTLTIERPAKLDELDVLKRAADALQRHDEALAAYREAETQVKALCRAYDLAAGVWGFQPHHLRNACKARGLL